MTQVQILENCKGTQDGFKVEQFKKDDVVDIREGLARQLFKDGYAKKTIDQQYNEWMEILSQKNDALRNIDIGDMERELKDSGDVLGLKYFRMHQFNKDVERSLLKAVEG